MYIELGHSKRRPINRFNKYFDRPCMQMLISLMRQCHPSPENITTLTKYMGWPTQNVGGGKAPKEPPTLKSSGHTPIPGTMF